MLTGNPDTFAIWCDAVPSWSDDRFKNGCFGYFLDGQLVWSLRSTLGVDMLKLSDLSCMSRSVENNAIFNAPTTVAYADLCASAYPVDFEAEDNDFTYVALPVSLSDEGYNIFLIESGDRAKLICGLNDDLLSVRDVILKRGEFQSVVQEAIRKYKELAQ